jgi:phosphomannomutase
VLVCIEGKGRTGARRANYPFAQGDVVLLPAVVGACRCRPNGTVTLLEISLPEISYDAMKKLIVFDLDGTLAESKSSIDAEMAKLLDSLLGIVKVSVISGGAWLQFEKQVLAHLSHDERLKNLSLLPTCGTKFYKYDSKWELLYSEDFTDAEKQKIIGSLKKAMESSDCKVEKVWGESSKTGAARSRSPLGATGSLGREEEMGS